MMVEALGKTGFFQTLKVGCFVNYFIKFVLSEIITV